MDDKKRKPIAILQFVNKTDFKHIEQYDLVSCLSASLTQFSFMPTFAIYLFRTKSLR